MQMYHKQSKSIMEKLVILFCLTGVTLAGPMPFFDLRDDLMVNQTYGKYGNPSPSDMTYNFYSLQNPNNPVQATINSVSNVKNSHFTPSKDTVIIIHGYWENGTTDMPTKVKGAIIDGKHDVNIIVIDWSKVWKNNNQNLVIQTAGQVGSYMGAFINELVKDYKLDLSRTILVGHSFGGLYIGKTGAALGGKVKALFALDPFPGATKADGQYLQVIHTTSLSNSVVGHADFYPCGGGDQNGCNNNGGCSHGRAFVYYAESINSNKFVGRHCSNYEEYKAGKCNSNPSSVFGTLKADSQGTGKYFLDVNTRTPYAKG